jgi:hypothetical protein
MAQNECVAAQNGRLARLGPFELCCGLVVWPPIANSGDRSARRSEHVYVRARARLWHDACRSGLPTRNTDRHSCKCSHMTDLLLLNRCAKRS